MVRHVASLVLAVLVLVLLPPAASPAAAQNPRQILITPAFTILKWDDTGFGFNVDVGVPLKAKTAMTFDVVGDFSFLRFGEDQETDLFFSGAPRVRFTKNASATPFVQMQVGVNRWMDEGTSGSNFFIGPGGGVIFPIGNYHFKLQIDFPIVMFDEGSDTTTRFSFGIEFPRRK